MCANLNSGADCKKPWQQSTLSLFAFAAMAGASWRASVSKGGGRKARQEFLPSEFSALVHGVTFTTMDKHFHVPYGMVWYGMVEVCEGAPVFVYRRFKSPKMSVIL